ncbi:hypothetical protein AAZX31_01G224800 [Glycine max]|uniref:Alpha/beta hydrolase fold-3 domain-containing protein n=2 Tax=Glycine subgen. Soja TaxID=1462606 RepID=I1JAV0_SOYBN|nr:2-hydroxyisoflavanone dehydratase-like protein [Glycine max]XP_028180935.1 2-hydroxyisoflavanone dehydratase-like [Glycine soja]KAG5070406.1 hypothetical protein JHK85_002783 [Glycine max]KAG5090104.1 hypothetical protein JHK86_002716 [Glycine max]KAH1164468.1 hypothetical protein GYH30_002480 [Glycine max]KAH1267813.1 2-hydroxyisoflavanone dehydratase [Glycine max]KHN30461.1 Putative carboxylesterase 2 [Glycine soja]|eukprot:NP_001276288.2 2-hydroxyisoflavanone dehydratase-like protein [Glycine max]
MDSSSINSNSKEITMEIPSLVRLYKDGTIERLQNSPIVPPTLQDPTSSKDVVISGDPLISARLFLPNRIRSQQEGHKVPILVYFHGGGFFFESAFNQLHHNYFNKFVSVADVLVVSVEYRLAPETLLPAAYDDCWDALKWVATNTEPWLVKHGDFNRVFIGGDSAGANIVHNIAMRAGAEALPGGVKLLGAFLSHSYFYGSKPIGSEPVAGHQQSVPYLVWDFVYPSAPGGIDNPMINPMVTGAPSLAGLGCSKILVCVAEKDLIKDRGVAYYEAVKKSGWQGEAELFEVEGEDHAFHIHNPQTQNAMKMIKRLSDFLLH